MGLTFAYAGTNNEEVSNSLLEVLEDFSFGYDVSAFTSMGIGLVSIGSGDEDLIGSLISVIFFKI